MALIGIIDNRRKVFSNEYIYAVMMFLLASSLSVINAININSFFLLYSKIILGFTIYISTAYVIKKVGPTCFLNDMFYAIFFCAIVIMINQFTLFFTGNVTFIGSIDTIRIAIAHLKINGKLFDDSLLEVMLPFFFFVFLHKKGICKLLCIVIVFAISLLSIFSLFRYRLLAVIIAFVLFIVFEKDHRPQILSFLMILFTVFYITTQFTNHSFKTTFNRIDDLETINWRLNIDSLLLTEIPEKYIPFGIGLGNTYDYLSWNQKQTNSIVLKNALQNGPHNLFIQYYIEAGILGLFSVLWIIGIAISNLLKTTYMSNEHIMTVYFSFFVLLSISQFNPSTNFNFYFLFFFFLAIISSHEKLDTKV